MAKAIYIPKNIAEKLKSRGLDPETYVVELLAEKLKLDPSEEALAHLDLARRFLDEAKRVIDSDPVQASEKLYKVAEECLKALTVKLRLENVLRAVRSRGRWTVSELEKAAEALADKLGSKFYDAWDHAWVLHVWGFHEAKLDSEAVRRRLPYVEYMLKVVEEILKSEQQNL